MEDAVKCVDYFTDLKKNRGLSNLVALNNSWGGGYSQALFDAIERANQQNILFVAAAGNGNIFGFEQNNDSRPAYPASYGNANIIAVASITSSGALSSFLTMAKHRLTWMHQAPVFTQRYLAAMLILAYFNGYTTCNRNLCIVCFCKPRTVCCTNKKRHIKQCCCYFFA